MRRIVLFALALVGCAPPATPPPSVATASSVAGAPPAPSKKSNPNRIFQLGDLRRTEIDLKGHKARLWVMDDDQKQEEGMMFLTDGEVKPDEGMLFAFKELQRKADNRSFWMHNTLIPLDIVYLSPTGKVLNVGHGKVQDDSPVPAAGDYLNVIELKAGTAARYGLRAGDTVRLPKASAS